MESDSLRTEPHLSDQKCGSHDIRIEGDIIFLTIHGVVTERDLQTIIQMGNAIADRHPGYWILGDVNDMTSMDPAARRLAAVNPRLTAFRGAALLGASTVHRILISLVVRAMHLLGTTHVQMGFVASREEGLCWLAQHKAKDLAAHQ